MGSSRANYQIDIIIEGGVNYTIIKKYWAPAFKNNFLRMIRLKTVFSDVKPEILYDVLHDPDYRKVENIGQN